VSLLESFTKRKILTAAINQTTTARVSEGKVADSLYKGAYQDYAEVLIGDPLRSETLYNWGFALLHQAKTKAGDEAIRLYDEAIAKFSFCLLLNPSYLGAAINGGVAYMDLARLKAVDSHDELYEQAKSYFEQANAIQAGSASYNLACIYGLRDERQACLDALENAKSKGYLPEAEEIMADPDLDIAKTQPWFAIFMATLAETDDAENVELISETGEQPATEAEETEPVQEETERVAESEESIAKID
jgi:tetratricopeptide (TPR) repeat protein